MVVDPTWRARPYAVDLRVPRSYRLEATSHGIGVTGEFLHIQEPHHLQMTWVWPDDGTKGDLEESWADSGTVAMWYEHRR